METIKVNMNPNPLDVQTIHASQNDGEARQWEFELHNNGELIDTSDVKEQLVFKAYKGGTEQILPENTSTPTTSPFLGDIRYPQGLLTDQEFTYRESPTESDGLAKITDIKGNTLVWNQQANPSGYVTGTYSNVSVTKSQDETYLIANGTASATAYIRLFSAGTLTMISGHKYCCVVPTDSNVAYYDDSSPRQYSQQFSSFVFTSNGSPIRPYARIENGVTSTNRRISFMMFDLTQMGLDITDPSEFTSLFSLPYYDFNQGSLLSFNGNGIKTVGFNLAESWVSSGVSKPYADTLGIEGKLMPNTAYCFSFVGNNGNKLYPNENIFTSSPRLTCTGNRQQIVLTTLPNIAKDNSAQYQNGFGWRILKNDGGNTVNSSFSDVCMNFNDTSKNGTYEPYTESVLSLPISTYFPTGMKSAGSVYDELTPRKAITRIGELNIDSSTTIATWESNDGWTANLILNTYKPNGAVKSDKFEFIGFFVGASAFVKSAKAKGGYCIGAWQNSNRLYFYSSTASTSNDLINAIRGTNLYYELATPTETSFTTASLVTENAEIPLSNEDGTLIGKCTEELSAEPGFHDAKIKLSDSDGECYSNKLQLHVERSPQ